MTTTSWQGAGDATHRSGTALCLSGGGFRSSLVHLGALRRLDEVEALTSLTTACGVSGGALVVGLLADRRLDWSGPHLGGLEQHVAQPLTRLTSMNIRTPALLARLAPGRWGQRDAGVRALARRLRRAADAYREPLDRPRAGGPRLVVTATDLVTGGPFVIGSGESAPTAWDLADAIAASGAIPPFFAPRRTGGAQLVDGGVWDNLALEPVWRTHALLLVSDGGAVVRARTERTLFGRLLRTAEVLGRSGLVTRLAWLAAGVESGRLRAATWSIGDPVEAGDAATYPADVARLAADVRTDLDAFSSDEQRVLQNHGYLLAAAAIRRETPELARDVPVRPPFPELMDPGAARRALAGSARRTLVGRL